MAMKGMTAALVAACMVAAGASTAQAGQPEGIGAEQSGFVIPDLLGGPKGPKPPPKLEAIDPVTNPPGPRPPPRPDGLDPVTNPPGPKPPPR